MGKKLVKWKCGKCAGDIKATKKKIAVAFLHHSRTCPGMATTNPDEPTRLHPDDDPTEQKTGVLEETSQEISW